VMSMGRPYLPSVDSRYVSDGDWGNLPVYPTHQTDGSVPRDGVGVRHSTCTVPNLMRISISDTEHVQSGAALFQRWTWSQRDRRSIDSNTANGEGGTSGSCRRWQYDVVSRMERSCLWQHVTDVRNKVPDMQSCHATTLSDQSGLFDLWVNVL
jgi:hypothetical protein